MFRSADQTQAGRGRVVRPNAAAYKEAGALLRAGGLVAFPTETVYGLGADATDDEAVAAIFEAKGRPRFNPLIVHVRDAESAARLVVFDDRAQALAKRFWPGPLSLVLHRTAECPISLLCSAGLETLAIRVPDHGVGQALLRAVGRPLAAPSANPSGALSPTTATHVARSLGDAVPLILDGGPCPVGLESTVLDLSGAEPVLLRPGGVALEALEPVAGRVLRADRDTGIKAPGMLASHYAPGRPLRLDAQTVAADEALLAFGPEPLAGAASGRPTARKSAWPTPWSGTRTARVSSPALHSSETRQPGARGNTRLSGPGQNAAASAQARSSKATSRAAASASATCTISGLKLGRPLASKMAATARSLLASAPRP